MAQQGSTAALGTLYQRYLPSVWRYVYTHVGGDRHVVEDLVSETFLAALRGLKKLDADSRPLYPWLISVARHKLGDHRRRARRSEAGVRVPGQDAVDTSLNGDPPGYLLATERKALAARAMARLPDEERLALEWKYVDELSVRDIARRMGRTEKAVENLLYRARKSFRATFSESQGSRS